MKGTSPPSFLADSIPSRLEEEAPCSMYRTIRSTSSRENLAVGVKCRGEEGAFQKSNTSIVKRLASTNEKKKPKYIILFLRARPDKLLETSVHIIHASTPMCDFYSFSSRTRHTTAIHSYGKDEVDTYGSQTRLSF